jgi:hypothetical protein
LKEETIKFHKLRWADNYFKFDEQGRVIEYAFAEMRFVVTYSDSLRRRSLAKYKNGKIVYIDSLRWNGRKLAEVASYDSHGKLVTRERYQYDSTMLREYVYEKKKRGKLREVRKTTYEYYPDKSNKKIVYYERGKVKRYSVFDCDPRGLTHKAKKDSTFNCVKYEVDSLGNRMEVQVVNQKGYPFKMIRYFNSENELIAMKSFSTKKDDRLVWEYHYLPGTSLTTHFINYSRNKKFYEMHYDYNDNNKCISSFTYKRKKLKERTENEFSEKGLIVKTRCYNHKNKLRSTTDYSYTYY